MADAAPFKIGDLVFAEFKNGDGVTTSRPSGPIVDINETQAQVQCSGFVAWIDLTMLKAGG